MAGKEEVGHRGVGKILDFVHFRIILNPYLTMESEKRSYRLEI